MWQFQRTERGYSRADCRYAYVNFPDRDLHEGLVRNGLLVPEGFGRGTRYALAGEENEKSLVSEGSSLAGPDVVQKVRESQKAPGAIVEQAILTLCADGFLPLVELAQALNRSPQRLRAYVGKLVERGLLELRFPEERNHPQQACRAVQERKPA